MSNCNRWHGKYLNPPAATLTFFSAACLCAHLHRTNLKMRGGSDRDLFKATLKYYPRTLSYMKYNADAGCFLYQADFKASL